MQGLGVGSWGVRVKGRCGLIFKAHRLDTPLQAHGPSTTSFENKKQRRRLLALSVDLGTSLSFSENDLQKKIKVHLRLNVFYDVPTFTRTEPGLAEGPEGNRTGYEGPGGTLQGERVQGLGVGVYYRGAWRY